MGKRALILWVCMAFLLLSAAKVTAVLPSQADGPSSSASSSEMSASPSDPSFKLLSAAYGPPQPAIDQPSIPAEAVTESTLWLARAIYSETKLPHEQELVAWVVRNRVETGYRSQTSYEDVVLDPYQFSGFNPGTSKRSLYSNLTPDVQLPAWQQALWIAHYVRHADPSYRPFSRETRHFYSERSMRGRKNPFWAEGRQFVQPSWEYEVNERRFRFYEEVS